MNACFHIAGVQCDICRTGLKDDRPYVAVVTTGGTYLSEQDFLTALRQVEIERDEARKEAAKYRQLHDMEVEARKATRDALTAESARLIAEVDRLHGLLRKALDLADDFVKATNVEIERF